MKMLRVAFLITILGLFLDIVTHAQTKLDGQGYIYGKVTTVDDNTYTGQIRWGKEEALWGDLFNSSKEKNPFLKYVRGSDDEKYPSRDKRKTWNFENLFSDNRGRSWSISINGNSSHVFTCFFGEIKMIEVTGREAIILHLKNGERINLDGGSNDIGATIRVADDEVGEINVKWKRITKIEFMPSPKSLKSKWGEPIYGTVKSESGTFTGQIQWDEDEALTQDELDGDNDDGDMKIPFANISKIKREGRGVRVTTRSGKNLRLTGSNDVNSSNRGIIVKVENVGRVKVNWDEFEEAVFEPAPNSGPSYDDFKNASRIKGTVVTRKDKRFSGLIVYDLDEMFDIEMLDGDNEETEFKIPFRNIKKIIPKNYNYATVVFKNGDKLLLGDSQDVSERNTGILVFKTEKDEEPEFIEWDEVKEVQLD